MMSDHLTSKELRILNEAAEVLEEQSCPFMARKVREVAERLAVPPTATPDECVDLASALERRWVKETVVAVYRMAEGRMEPYWHGFTLACDEIACRLQEAYGEEPTDAEAWVSTSVTKDATCKIDNPKGGKYPLCQNYPHCPCTDPPRATEEKDAGYTNCDICDQRQGTHEIAYGGVRCDECREKAEATPRRIASVDSAGYATFERDPNYSGKAAGKSHE